MAERLYQIVYALEYVMNIPVNTDTLLGYLIRRISLTVVYAGILSPPKIM